MGDYSAPQDCREGFQTGYYAITSQWAFKRLCIDTKDIDLALLNHLKKQIIIWKF
jgi:hypothetical protein